MAILEASGKQEPEAKETPAGPLEEVRVPLPKGGGAGAVPFLRAHPATLSAWAPPRSPPAVRLPPPG